MPHVSRADALAGALDDAAIPAFAAGAAGGARRGSAARAGNLEMPIFRCMET